MHMGGIVMNSRERILKTFEREPVDRVPVLCVNSTATLDQMEKQGSYWPEAHVKGEDMAQLALGAYTVLGFDAVRVPFCQTFEAEALGCKIKYRGREDIPNIDHPNPYVLDDTPTYPDDFLQRGRIPELIKAVKILKEKVGDKAIVMGGIIGPFTIAASLLGNVPILKATMKAPEKIIPFLEVGERAGTTLALALVEAGADMIAIEDMGASPALISPDTYKRFEIHYQKKQAEQIPVPAILHICGNVDKIIGYMGESGVTSISLEPKASTLLARDKLGNKMVLIGGIDTTTTLFLKDVETVKRGCRESLEEGIDILAPGCAIAPGTPTENLRAMVEVAQEFHS
jgi:[methyl-Co(III) methanol-specific corrinoid protein]:coenzyme M methyltransferase